MSCSSVLQVCGKRRGVLEEKVHAVQESKRFR